MCCIVFLFEQVDRLNLLNSGGAPFGAPLDQLDDYVTWEPYEIFVLSRQ